MQSQTVEHSEAASLPHTVGWPHLVHISEKIEAASHNFVASYKNDNTHFENTPHKMMFFVPINLLSNHYA